MEFLLLLHLSLICPVPVIFNESPEKWNNRDTQNFEAAVLGCPRKFENSPCLKVFTKVKPLTYHAICGRPNIRDNQR